MGPVKLSVPLPEKMDQVPVVALPPTLAPVRVMAVGAQDELAFSVPPVVTMATGFTVMTTSEKEAVQGLLLIVQRSVYVPAAVGVKVAAALVVLLN